MKGIIKKWPIPSLPAGRFSRWSLPPVEYHHVLVPLMIMIIAFQSAGIFYKIVGARVIAPQRTHVVRKEPFTITPLPKEPANAYKAIVSRNLFGSSDKALDDKAQVAEAPPLPSLLELRGTVTGDEKKYGFAVILEKGKNKQVLVKAGSQVAGATLLKIARDHAIFRYLGNEEYLKKGNSTETPILQGAVGPNPLPSRPSTIVPSSVPPSGNITISLNEVNEDMKDSGKMLSQAQIRPFFSAGALDGYMISQIHQGSVFQKMGLREGDIIQGINNRKLKSAEEMMNTFTAMRSAPSMSLTIKRANIIEKINYIVK